jgi:hypothetical protein
MTYFGFLKLFLSLSFLLYQPYTFAQIQCGDLFKKSGAQILHERDSTLHTSKAVEKAVKKHKASTNETVTKPADKIELWLASLTKIAEKADSSSRTLEQIKTLINEKYLIKLEDVPQSYFDLQVRLARERGHGEITLSDKQKKELAEHIINDQKNSLDIWTEYLVSKDTSMYPMWLKFWMFTGMAKLGKYDLQTGQFGNRSKTTMAPFAELNREAVGLLTDYVLTYLDKKSLDEIRDPELAKLVPQFQFGKLYGQILKKLNLGKDGLFITNEGKWIIYKQGSDHLPLVRSLEGHNTGWCTAGKATAEVQLKKGDFHVYYSLDQNGQPSIPRVAIRMENNEIAEVRGVAQDQNLDRQINQSTVVSLKMKEFGSKADQFKKRDHDMRLLTQIETKHNAGIPLTKEEVKFLWEIDNHITGFGYTRDPRISSIRSSRKFDLMELYDLKPEEITFTEKEFFAAKGTSKLHFGYLKLSESQARELKSLHRLQGNLDLSDLKTAKGLKLPDSISGDLNLSGLTTAEGLKLPKSIGRNLFLDALRSAKGLKLPDSIKNLHLRGLTSAKGLKLPDSFPRERLMSWF